MNLSDLGSNLYQICSIQLYRGELDPFLHREGLIIITMVSLTYEMG